MKELIVVIKRIVRLHWYTWKSKYIFDMILKLCYGLVWLGFVPKTLLNWNIRCYLSNSKKIKQMVLDSDMLFLLPLIEKTERAYRNIYIDD